MKISDKLASIFLQPEVTHDTVQIAGENIRVALYNGAKKPES